VSAYVLGAVLLGLVALGVSAAWLAARDAERDEWHP
jgi:hypothetical protein